jgi:hypothetical protein
MPVQLHSFNDQNAVDFEASESMSWHFDLIHSEDATLHCFASTLALSAFLLVRGRSVATHFMAARRIRLAARGASSAILARSVEWATTMSPPLNTTTDRGRIILATLTPVGQPFRRARAPSIGLKA